MATPTIQGGYTNQVVKKVVPTLPKTNVNVSKPYTDKNAEIQRTQSVIAERQKAGMDVSAQLSHYKNLTGKSYTPLNVNNMVGGVGIGTNQTMQSTSPKYGYGTISENSNKVGFTDKNTEINRTIGVIGNRFNDDVDISAQLAHYKNLTGKDFTKDSRYNELVVTKDVTGKVKAEIEAKTKALKDQLAMQQQASDFAVGQNNAYLQEQIGKMQKQKVVNDDSAAKLQNRRGGFYSGGLDYQLGQNLSSYNEASGGLSRDIAARNADIYAKNSMLAQQAAEQISQLQQSAPALIRERVLQELDRQRGIAMDEAQLTGMYNGQQTLEAQHWNKEFGLREQQLKLQKQSEEFDRDLKLQQFAYAKLRDKIEDERWKTEFDEDVRRYGVSQALERQVSLGNLGVRQAELALSQAKFDYDKAQPKGETVKDETGKEVEVSKKDLSKNYAEAKEEVRSAINGKYSYSDVLAYIDSIRDSLSDSDYRKLIDYADKELNE